MCTGVPVDEGIAALLAERAPHPDHAGLFFGGHGSSHGPVTATEEMFPTACVAALSGGESEQAKALVGYDSPAQVVVRHRRCDLLLFAPAVKRCNECQLKSGRNPCVGCALRRWRCHHCERFRVQLQAKRSREAGQAKPRPGDKPQLPRTDPSSRHKFSTLPSADKNVRYNAMRKQMQRAQRSFQHALRAVRLPPEQDEDFVSVSVVHCQPPTNQPWAADGLGRRCCWWRTRR